MADTASERTTRWKRKRHAAGRCEQCGRKPRPGMRTCLRCARDNVAAARRRRERRSGLRAVACHCGLCGKEGHNRRTCDRRTT